MPLWLKGFAVLGGLLVIWALKSEYQSRVFVTIAIIVGLGFLVLNRGKK